MTRGGARPPSFWGHAVCLPYRRPVRRHFALRVWHPWSRAPQSRGLRHGPIGSVVEGGIALS
ncbi:hypothetical protein JG687_00006911 [Phytophthora cactorum]|uniref:Uncharacterized protein n=1 Tax=Phytophthora cactorum TaxID=29920 RepID=A0A8T1UI45_9STRA|nr:hypothetical protein JG687_00006911 [Phytophthora cactorum]